MAKTVRPEILRASILERVCAERFRQETLLAEGKFHYTAASDNVDAFKKLSVLTEEVGEVARGLNDGDDFASVQEELIQVAAVAVAWAEAIERAMGEAQ